MLKRFVERTKAEELLHTGRIGFCDEKYIFWMRSRELSRHEKSTIHFWWNNRKEREKIILFFKLTIMPIKRIICSMKKRATRENVKCHFDLLRVKKGFRNFLWVLISLSSTTHQSFTHKNAGQICRLYSLTVFSTLSNGDFVWTINFHALFKSLVEGWTLSFTRKIFCLLFLTFFLFDEIDNLKLMLTQSEIM